MRLRSDIFLLTSGPVHSPRVISRELRWKQFSRLVILAAFLSVSHTAAQPADRKIANEIFSEAFTHKMIDQPVGSVVVFVGKKFLGFPYEANTLDVPDSEQLVCDLHSFDCVTFVENVLALSLCIKNDRLSYDAYQNELMKIRYRGGRLQGYASRLHYFSDWIYDNARKGIVDDVTDSVGGVPYKKTINFMTTHRSSYRKLVEDSMFRQIAACEESLRTRTMFYIPKSDIEKVQSAIQTGDIIAITSAQAGLDISHTGIAVKSESGELLFLHAPDVGEKVTMISEPLGEYLKRHAGQTGIMVARPRNPA